MVTGSKADITTTLTTLAAAVLALDPTRLNPHTGFSEYGFDSMLLKEFAARIAHTYAVDLSPSVFFRFSTIAALSDHLSDHLADHLSDHLKQTGIQSPSPILPPPSAVLDDQAVAIVGISGLFPGSPTLQDFWRNLVAGRDLISETPADRWDWRQCAQALAGTGREAAVRWAGFLEQVAEFDPLFFGISPREAEQMDPQHRLFLQQTWHAIENAGMRPSSLAGTRTAVFVGVQMNEYVERFSTEAGPQVATGNAHSMIANRVSYLLDLRGPSEVIDTACSSALVAVHRAAQSIRSGEAECAIAGGVHLLLSPDAVLMAARMGVLSASGRCRTFDEQADGYVKGEGVGVVVLKSARQAQADGDFIYATIRGTGVNHGGHAMSLTAPNAEAQAALITQVYTQAGIDPDSVTFIETHGTGTPLGDPVEVDALTEAFEQLHSHYGKLNSGKPHSGKATASVCWLGAVKTNIGHLEPASGMAGLLKVVLAMQHQTIPATLHQASLNPLLRLDRGRFQIATSTQAWSPFIEPSGRAVFRAGVSSFGFGGTNCHILLEHVAVPAASPAAPSPNAPELIPLAAKTPTALRESVLNLEAALGTWAKDYPFHRVAYTLQAGRDHFAERVAFVASDRQSLCAQMQAWLNGAAAVTGDSPAEQAARHWMAGETLTWKPLSGVNPGKVPLPGYPFARTKHWVAAKTDQRSPLPNALPATADTLTTLRSRIGQTLGMAETALDDQAELSALGLDSLVQAELRQSLETLLGVSLPADVFLRYPTIAQLATNLPTARTNDPLPPASPSPLMICHEHAGNTPSFWIHGAPGDTNWLLSLSQALGSTLPLIGIEAMEADHSSIEALAGAYLAIIQANHPVDRYRIGGYSFGGAVAVEMCRLLEQQGGCVEDVILFDTYAPGSADLQFLKDHAIVTDPAFASLLIGNMLVQRWHGAQALELADFQGLNPAEHVEVIVNRISKDSPLQREQLVRSIRKACQFAARHDQLLNAYQPQPFKCHARVTLFRAALGFTAPANAFSLPPIAPLVGDSPAQWRKLLGTDVVVCEVARDHFGLLSDAEASGIAKALREILGR